MTTIEELEGKWPEPSADSTQTVRRCTALRRKPIEEFAVEDFRILIGQRIGVAELLPLALEMLLVEPLVCGDLFPGDLLKTVAGLPDELWAGHEDARARLRAAVANVLDGAGIPVDVRALLETFVG